MLFGNNRETYRQTFIDTWHKYQKNEDLEPLEQQVLAVLLQHPEYHALFNQPEKLIEKNFTAEHSETNPFLHMSLHMGVLDQVKADKPKGMRKLYQDAIGSFGDVHEAEHCLAANLAYEMKEVTDSGKPFNEKRYLKRLKKFIHRGAW